VNRNDIEGENKINRTSEIADIECKLNNLPEQSIALMESLKDRLRELVSKIFDILKYLLILRIVITLNIHFLLNE